MNRYDANPFAEEEVNPFAVSSKPLSYLQNIRLNGGIMYSDLVFTVYARLGSWDLFLISFF